MKTAAKPKTTKKAKTHQVGARRKALQPKKQVAEGADKPVKRVEIYALLDPRDNAIRYIGKANDAVKRLRGHLSETRRATPVYCWIGKLRALGLTPTLQVLCVCTTENWRECECEAIANARLRGLKLLNLADGGDEPYCSPETRAENGRRNAIARTSTPRRASIYKAKRALGALLKQGHVREDTKVKLRALAALQPELFGAWATI